MLALPPRRRPLLPLPPLVVDGVTALALTAGSIELGLCGPFLDGAGLDAVGIALTCAINLCLTVRRRAPMGVLLLCSALWVWYISLGYWPVVNSYAAMVGIYTVAAMRPPRWAAAASAVIGLVWIYGGVRTPHAVIGTAVVQAVFIPAVLWKFGDSARKLSLSNQRLSATAERLRREQQERAKEAAALERARIARELHDVLAHHLSVVSVQAGLARYVLDSDRATAARALDTVLETSSEALEELRRLLMLFRASATDARPFAPSAGLGQLPELAERITAAGVPVEVRSTGLPYLLPPGLDLCAYRIVQESLTNTLKHAPEARATVDIGYGEHELTIRITDDGGTGALDPRADPRSGTSENGGHGLLGMRERAHLYGGSLQAGPRPEGGFDVRFTAPTHGAGGADAADSPDS